MPFGALVAFNYMIMQVFVDLVGKCVFISLSNIILFQSHENNMQSMLSVAMGA